MSNLTIKKLSEVLNTTYFKDFALTETEERAALSWLELNSYAWLIAAKHKGGKNKAWSEIPEKAFLRYQVGKNVRKYFGCAPITEAMLAKHLADLEPWEGGIHNNKARMALQYIESHGVKATDENLESAYDSVDNIVRSNEQKRVNDTKNSYQELLELINGDFGKKVEKTEEYKQLFDDTVFSITEDRIIPALKGALSAYKRTFNKTSRKTVRAEVEQLIGKTEKLLETLGCDLDLIYQDIEQYSKGVALFDKFKK